jgi:hypothetical protein
MDSLGRNAASDASTTGERYDRSDATTTCGLVLQRIWRSSHLAPPWLSQVSESLQTPTVHERDNSSSMAVYAAVFPRVEAPVIECLGDDHRDFLLVARRLPKKPLVDRSYPSGIERRDEHHFSGAGRISKLMVVVQQEHAPILHLAQACGLGLLSGLRHGHDEGHGRSHQVGEYEPVRFPKVAWRSAREGADELDPRVAGRLGQYGTRVASKITMAH